jgi:hypothetical protein
MRKPRRNHSVDFKIPRHLFQQLMSQRRGTQLQKRAITAANVEFALRGGSGTSRTVTSIVGKALHRDKDS